MKQGTTTTFNFHFNIDLNQVDSIDFFFHCDRDNKQKRQPLLTKSYPTDGYEQDGVIYMPLKQEETAVLPNKFYIEPQINFIDKSSTKAHTKAYNMEPTIYTHFIDENQSSGEEENIDIEFEVDESIVIKGYDYDESYHKPRINDNELAGNKTGAELGLQDKLIAGVNITIAADGKTISAANGGKFIIVEELPEEDIDLTAIYLLPREDEEESNIYDEYIYIDSIDEWEKIGSTEVNLDNYYTKDETDELLDDKQDTMSATGHVSINNDVITTEANKVYPAVMSGGNISYNVSDYPNIQYGDIAIINESGKFRIWAQEIEPDSSMVYWSEIEYSNQKVTQSQNTPPSSAYGGYTIGDIWVQKITSPTISYKVFVLVDIAQTLPPKALTWVDLTSGNYTGGNGIDITNGVISADLDDNSILEFNNHKLSADTSGLQPTISGGNGIDVSSDVVSVDLLNGESVLGFSNGKLKSDLSAYYTKTEIDQMISTDLKFEVVQTLPSTPDTHTIYLVPKSTSETNNVYDEYMYINNAWELIGSTEVDLSNYQTLISSTNKVNADYIDDSESTNKFTNDNEKQTWNGKSKVWNAVYRNGEISQQLSDYDGIKVNDLVIDIDGVRKIYKVRILQTTSGTFGIGELSNFYYINGTPPTVSTKPQDTEIYFKDCVYFSDNGNIYCCTDIDDSQAPSQITFTWQTYKGTDTTYTAGTGLTLSSGAFSVDNPVPSGTSSDYGKYLKNNNGQLEWASVSGGGSYSGGDGIDITNDTISVDLKSGTELQITSGELDIDLSGYQTTIDSTHKLSADNVDDTSTTNKFVTSTEKSTWNGKADNTTISTDTTSTTVSLTLADNHEYRYTQDLTSLTLTMPNGDFIASIVFASGSTPTSMTYDSSIKWSGDDVTNGQFVPTEKTYNVVMWYDGLNINGVVRGV